LVWLPITWNEGTAMQTSGPVEQHPAPLSAEEITAFREWLAERNRTRRIIVGISGASAPVYGIRTLEALAKVPSVETHLVMTDGAKEVMKYELGYDDHDIARVLKCADVVYHNSNMAAAISSGSFKTDGMIVAPCSMKTLADIALSRDESLIARAAICQLKESRRVVIVPRETPATLSYLNNLVLAKTNGAEIVLPVPAYYHRPQTLDDIINHTVQKVLDLFGIELNLFRRWETPEDRTLD
jgi:4-hydroxy-3-polyprenylbenzoate decarboxylase